MGSMVVRLAGILGLSLVAASGSDELQAFLKTLSIQEESVRVALEDEGLWSDPAKRETLGLYLDAARQLRAPSLAPVLAKHLDYSPIEGEGDGERTVEERYPACAALVAIGTPAVPTLIELLSVTVPFFEERQKHMLAVSCLVKIYEPGGNGAYMARQQIALARHRANNEGQRRLLVALWQHPALRTFEEAEISAFLMESSVQRHAVQKALEDDALWERARRWEEHDLQKTLNLYLALAYTLPSPSLAPAMARHLDYFSIARALPTALGMYQPAYGALVKIGTPAVPALIEVLSSVDPEDRSGRGEEQRRMAVGGLIKIYEPGGNGPELARLQLELAAERASGKTVHRLTAALDVLRLHEKPKVTTEPSP